MTVLRPSLPPDSSSTTRMVSLPGAAARAVRATNCGTTEPSATSDEPCRARVRNCRRVKMVRTPRRVGGWLRQMVHRNASPLWHGLPTVPLGLTEGLLLLHGDLRSGPCRRPETAAQHVQPTHCN